MKKIFKYLSALTLGAVLFTSCDMNKLPVFDDKDAFVAFNSATASVVENAGSVNVPVTLASLKGLNASVAIEAVDGSAKAGVNYVVETATVTFTADAPTQYVTVKIINNDSFTGDLKFTLKLGNTGDVNAGAENACTVTITDKDHPLDPILGVWIAQAESIWYGAQKYDVTFMKDASDPYKVWIDNWGAKDGWNGDDTVIYGVVSEDLTTITIPFGQATEYVYSNGEACLYEGVDSSLNTSDSGEWILSISDDKKSMVETAGYGVYYYIPGAGGLQALVPGITLSR